MAERRVIRVGEPADPPEVAARVDRPVREEEPSASRHRALPGVFSRKGGGGLAAHGAPVLVLSHGAGAGMEHAFMEALTGRLTASGVTVFRYQFPYMEAGRRWPDGTEVAVATVRAAVEHARDLFPGRPIFAGGKSFGGRMTSTALARPGDGTAEPDVLGLVFFGFPLHSAKKPGTERAAHLSDVHRPMLFLQGTRDRLADLQLLRPVVEELGERATLHVVEGADHGFHVLKRSGRTDEEVLDELVHAAAAWMAGVERA